MKRLLIEYQVFLTHIREIEDFLIKVDKNASIEKVIAFLSGADKEIEDYAKFIKSLGGSPLSYNAIIISLYGCFENYIDKLLGVYLEILTEKKQKYDELPDTLKTKYRFKFGEFLSNPQRFSGIEMFFEKEIHNYCNVIDSKMNGNINKQLVLSHAGNLHVKEVFDLMTVLGIDNPRSQILDYHLFREFHINAGMDTVEYERKRARNNDELFSPIEKLIDQRNSVAHSWNVEDRLTLKEISDSIVPYMVMFCDCVYRLCLIHAFSLDDNLPIFEVNEPITVINKRIVCMNNQNRKVSVGDYLIYVSNDNVKIAKIINLQVDSQNITSIPNGESKNVGIQLDNTIKTTDKLKFVINSI